MSCQSTDPIMGKLCKIVPSSNSRRWPFNVLGAYKQKCISTLVTIIRSPTNEEELSAAVGIISRLPHDPQTSQNLLELGALKAIIDCLTWRSTHASDKKGIIENATESLRRFTVPSNLKCQKIVAESGIIPDLVSLLESGTCCTKQNVAIMLKQLSENTSKLTFREKKGPFFSCWFKSPETICPLHGGSCTIESSFCFWRLVLWDPFCLWVNQIPELVNLP